MSRARKTEIDIKVGDVVYLRSGSPAMTVHALTLTEDKTYTLASVIWFNSCCQVGCATIPTLCLHAEKVDEACRALIGE